MRMDAPHSVSPCVYKISDLGSVRVTTIKIVVESRSGIAAVPNINLVECYSNPLTDVSDQFRCSYLL